MCGCGGCVVGKSEGKDLCAHCTFGSTVLDAHFVSIVYGRVGM